MALFLAALLSWENIQFDNIMTTPTLNKLAKAHVLSYEAPQEGSNEVVFFEGATESFSVSLSADQLRQAAEEIRSLVNSDPSVPVPTPVLDLFDKGRVFSLEREGTNEFFFEDLGAGHFAVSLDHAELLQLANDFESLAEQVQLKPTRKSSAKP